MKKAMVLLGVVLATIAVAAFILSAVAVDNGTRGIHFNIPGSSHVTTTSTK